MSLLRRVLSTAALLCSLGATALAVVLVLVPLVTDSVPLTVLTGSMAPVHDPGDVVVVRPTQPEDLRVGDVITFEAGDEDPRLITHRIEATGVDAAGEPSFVTRGDANQVSDAEPVMAGQVRGRVWYAVPWIGRASGALGPHRDQILVGSGLVLLALALRELGVGRRRRPEAARTDDATPQTSSATAHGATTSVA
ncbi:signal peptidase I [Nocardioides sp. dk4132]|uniref:signal peptidase I n=1 Tax=unclassified Nocardioides TaxID=2615069 RepID=UPI001296D15C|nr:MULTISPECIES: signal peptidase I [unclassified Nocardioides]MQW76896.1 signal peptidase I [Nocardioides sp. dk4132]QGA09323.1 signal peptidase I [Nocardioides sp. dk884]